MIRITNVKPLESYQIEVQFDTGEIGILDMTPYLDFGVFSQLRDPEHFRQVRISFGTVSWPEEIDLDPEFIYRNSRKKPRSCEPLTTGQPDKPATAG